MQNSNCLISKKRIAIIMAVFLVLSVLSLIFMGKVSINYNLADYLDDKTQTKIALDIIENEFGMTGSIQVMAENVSVDTAQEIAEKIKSVENVLYVSFDKNSENYYKDANALFAVITKGDDFSESAKKVAADIKELLSSYDGMEYGGTTAEKQSLQNAITTEMVYILAISLCLVVAILLITSESWIEPLVLLAASGVAVLINRGTNIFFGSISYITNSISAILQLALSIDYSIVLLHAYRRERADNDNMTAMSNAIKEVVKPVSASALTTIAGLLALLFMSFRIGFDIGTVLMKGIVISAITSVTLLPALVIMLDKPMRKTSKKSFVPHGKVFVKIAHRAGKIIVPVALALVILCGVLQTGNRYTFTDSKNGNPAINKVFGGNNSVVVVYKNSQGATEKEAEFITKVSQYKTSDGRYVFNDYKSCSNTIFEKYSPEKASDKFGLAKSDAEMLFTMYNLYKLPSSVKMTFSEFVNFADSLVKTDEDVKGFIDTDTAKSLEMLKTVSELASNEYTAGELYTLLSQNTKTDITLFSVRLLYSMYFEDNGETPGGKINGKTFVEYVIEQDKSNSAVHSRISEDSRLMLGDIITVCGVLENSQALTYIELYEKILALKSELKSNISPSYVKQDKISGVYIKYAVNNSSPLTSSVEACDLLDFVLENMNSNSLLSLKINGDRREAIQKAASDAENGKKLFIGENYSRMILSVNLQNEGSDTTDFVEYLSGEAKNVFGDGAYITGNIVSTYDLEKSFAGDNLIITLFTLVCVFVIVMLIFKSLSLPIILVAIIQGAIFIAMSTQLAGSIFFMSYIVATCILMGATIDYGILMSSNYVAYRKEADKNKSLSAAVETAMPTVFTSGLILTVCGFVIRFISSQNSVSTVGLLLGIGTICSAVMITIVLPSVLYLLDGFITKFSISKTNKNLADD